MVDQVLICDPSDELVFANDPQRGPQPTAILSLRNTSEMTLAFKIKTTNPQQFVVKPNSGMLTAQAEIKVQINAKADSVKGSNAKFLVQAVPLTIGPEPNWSSDNIITSKLGVRASGEAATPLANMFLSQDHSELNEKFNLLMASTRALQKERDEEKRRVQELENRIRFEALKPPEVKSITPKEESGGNITLVHLGISLVVGILVGLLFQGN